jgi:VanZ family protein
LKINIKSYWPAIVWLTISTIAFCIPVEGLPNDNWLQVIQIDKWIHVGIFMIMVLLWCLPLVHRSSGKQVVMKQIIKATAIIFCYGILMEFIQHALIPYRSFDTSDIVADAVGCLAGFFIIRNQWT